MPAYPEVSFPAFGSTTAAFLISELPGYQSREEVTLAAGAGKLPGGTVLAKNTSTNLYVPYVEGGANGTGTASAILWQEADTSAGAVNRTIIARGAEVQRAALFFAGTPSTSGKNAAYVSLEAKGIVTR